MSKPSFPSGHRRRRSLAPVGLRRPRDSPSSLASTRCFRTRLASSSPSISTRRTGAKTPRPFSKRVASGTYQWHLSDHDLAEARTPGSSLKRPFQPRLRDDWDRMSSPRRWRGARTSDSTLTTGCFRIKTRCRTEDSETLSLCRSRGRRANRTTRSFLMAPLFRGLTSGHF